MSGKDDWEQRDIKKKKKRRKSHWCKQHRGRNQQRIRQIKKKNKHISTNLLRIVRFFACVWCTACNILLPNKSIIPHHYIVIAFTFASALLLSYYAIAFTALHIPRDAILVSKILLSLLSFLSYRFVLIRLLMWSLYNNKNFIFIFFNSHLTSSSPRTWHFGLVLSEDMAVRKNHLT